MRKGLLIAGAALGSALLGLVVAGFALRAYYTDDRLRQLAEDQINQHLEGKFEIAAVRWRWPVHVEVGPVVIRSPRGQPVLAAAGVEAEVRLLPLLRGTLAVSHVIVDQPRVDVGVPTSGAEPPIAQAFKPKGEQPAVPEPVPLRIDFEDVTIAGAELEVRQGDMRFRVTELHLDDGFVWLGGDSVGGTVALRCDAHVQVKDQRMPIPGLAVRVEDVAFQFATETPRLKAPKVTLSGPGLGVEAAGELVFTATEVQTASAHARISVDTEDPALRLRLPGDLNTHLRGKADLLANLETKDGSHRLTADLYETRFEIYGMPVKGFHVDARYTPKTAEVDVRRVRLRMAQGDLDLEARVDVRPDGDVVAGKHDILLKLRDFPVRALAGQFVGLPALLPDGLSMTVNAKGRALYPPTNEVLVDVVPEGLPGEDWPGLPHSMELRGRFLMHPDLMEVLKLEVAVEHVPNFAIQGALPLQEQSFLDLIQAIHQANPKGPLRRIPAAPSSSRAL